MKEFVYPFMFVRSLVCTGDSSPGFLLEFEEERFRYDQSGCESLSVGCTTKLVGEFVWLNPTLCPPSYHRHQ